MKANQKKIIESRKSRTYFVTGMLIAMVVSAGGLFLAKTGHGGTQLFPDSFRAISLITVVGWVLGLLGLMAAAVISRRSKGIFTLTGESVMYHGVTPNDQWQMQNCRILDFVLTASWFESLTGSARIVLTVDNSDGKDRSVELGPFSRKVAETWLAESKRIIESSTQPAGSSKKKARSV
jgi:hypothetical protein